MILAAAWLCSILGIGLTWLVLLANAMNTVPTKLTLFAAIGLIVLPLLAVLASGAGISKAFAAQQSTKGVFIYLVPIGVSLFTVAMIAEAYNPKESLRSRNSEAGTTTPEMFSFDEKSGEPSYHFEIRRVLDPSTPDAREVDSFRKEKTYLVSDEVLLSTDDIASTYVGGPYTLSRYVVGVNFKPESHEKILELSRNDVGKQWAILLNDEVVATPMIGSAFSEKVIIDDQFDQHEAEKFARGIVGGM